MDEVDSARTLADDSKGVLSTTLVLTVSVTSIVVADVMSASDAIGEVKEPEDDARVSSAGR